MLFILSPTGSLNHEATGKFLDHLSSNIKEKIKLVVCLDTLVDANSKNLYVIPNNLAEGDALAGNF
jgi:hypothetical protein